MAASALSLILAPSLAGALELGSIRTQSALGEPFAGRIELLGVAPDELDTVKVLLASQAEFDKVGTARPHFLTGLEFQPRTSPRGQAIIRVTSRQPVREPFLDFLIKVDWPQGRLVKAYTVLLDSPATSHGRPPEGGQAARQRLFRSPVRTPPTATATPESALAVGERIETLHGRIRALETRLADMQRLLALNNERIAALQRTRPGQFDGAGAKTRDGPSPTLETTQESGGMTSREAAATPGPAPTVPHPGPEATSKAAEVERTPAAGHSFRESIPRSVPALVLVLALPLLFLGWMFRRRRKHREETSSPREPVLGIPGIAAAGIAAEAGSVEQISEGPATAPPTTQTPVPADRFGDLDAELEATDIVSEADVYIAYGRYREAETLLEKALAQSPQRLDVKYKLLIGACYGARNRPRMEALMDQLRSTGDARIDPDQWQRCKAMLEEDLKGADSQGAHPTAAAASEDIFMTAETETAQHRESVFPPPIPPGPAPEPESATATWASGVTDAPDTPRTTRPRTDSQGDSPHGSPEGSGTLVDDGMIHTPAAV